MIASEGSEPPENVRRRLRELPAVDRFAEALRQRHGNTGLSPTEATAVARAILVEYRRELLTDRAGEADLFARAQDKLVQRLRRVLNGTGVIVHTNLGRAPLADTAVQAVTAAARGYLNLEIDLTSGARRTRDAHVSEILCELTGADDALVVNNGAGAVLLAVAALGGPNRSIAVSRGQLVEIGGGFRIPDVIAQAGARLIEVGTTNRTRIEDYGIALQEGADLALRVHTSNFRMLGFVTEVDIETLCGLGVPVIDDIGSGAFAEDLAQLADEPPIRRSVEAGAAVVCFSGDKLIGGPQAGIMVGSARAIGACRRHPLLRALRVGRLPLAALMATLALYRDPARAMREIPVLAMLNADASTLHQRAERLAERTSGEILHGVSRVGGGALPAFDLAGPVVALDARADPAPLAATLRAGDPPLLARIARDRVVIDPRTLLDGEIDLAADVAGKALSDQGV
ncbi:MAG TPA: L-seryl-tRNA(Sec) selenium transferase [Solirubrobacteraceae bacterium]|nr:L-seryl-tRNA(Sec) selenium transferase [Solirubrobacteraceae bacterium]